jgi:hypothetical protein
LGGEIKVDWMGGALERVGKIKNAYKHLVGKFEAKRQLGRPKHRSEDNIRMGLREIRCEAVDWIYLAQDVVQWRDLVTTVMNLRVL